MLGWEALAWKLTDVYFFCNSSKNPDGTELVRNGEFQLGRPVGVYIDYVRIIHLIGRRSRESLLNLVELTSLYADPDGDGLDNITEYAFNLNPSTNDAHDLNES